MKHRDRVLIALNHETSDRCPMQVSFTPEFADRLRADMQMKGKTVHNPHGGGNSYELERALGQDMILTWRRSSRVMVRIEEKDVSSKDPILILIRC